MAKMTRSKLKGIVKECLVEILAEGIGTTTALNEAAENSRRQEKMLSIKKEQERLTKHRKNLDRKISETVSNITTDTLMQDILADTARNTLQEQIQHDRGPNSGLSPGNEGISLDNIFSESANNWSQLAFDDKKIS